MIHFENVSKVFQPTAQVVTALTDISFTVTAHEAFGIVGKSGSGKSTLLRLINNLDRPTSGRILINQQELAHLPLKEQRSKQQTIGMIFQHFNLLNNLTVKENIALPLKLQKRLDEKKITDVMEFVTMADKANYYPQQLSGGEKQRVAIARALSFEPAILLCDEPTSALDDQHAEEIIDLLKNIQSTFQTTIVIVSHEFDVIKQLCQRAAILEKGQLLDIVPVTPITSRQHYANYYQRAKAGLSQ